MLRVHLINHSYAFDHASRKGHNTKAVTFLNPNVTIELLGIIGSVIFLYLSYVRVRERFTASYVTRVK